MEMELLSADRLPLSALTELWNAAFRGYYVPMQLTASRFEALVRRELIALPDSLLAVADGQPVGFALAGLRWQNDRLLAYDAGTAVVPAWRGRGVATRLMRALLQRLTDIGAEQVALTAVEANQTAIELYQRQGFSLARRLTCWELPAAGGGWRRLRRPPELSIHLVPTADVLPLLAACYRQPPEWQNRPQGVKLAQSKALLASWSGAPVGYVWFFDQEPLYLYQLGVLPAWRRRGIGRALWNTLLQISSGNRCFYLNHPEEEVEGTAWLERTGFRVLLRQVEMRRSLPGSWRPRRASAADLPLMERVLNAAGLSVAGVRENPERFWLLYDRDDGLLGLVGAELADEAGLLRSLWVRPDQRGRGLGRRLLEHQERWLRSLGCTDVYLSAPGGETFFARQGYAVKRREQLPPAVDRSSEARTSCPLTSVVMHKPL